MSIPLPAIVIDDVTHSHSKKRRIGLPEPDCLPHNAAIPSRSTTGVEPYQAAPGIEERLHIGEGTVVCFGMILDRPVLATSDTAIAPSCAQESVLFNSNKELRRCKAGDLIGQLNTHDGKVLSKLQVDEELALQLIFATLPIAVEENSKPVKGTVGFLQIIIYGPRRRCEDVGDFMTRCGCYLEDPVACDRNVPYMNPQCLFSLHERFPMTFELPQTQQHSVDEFTRTSCDILASFETTDWLEEAVVPTALRTILKPHQRQALTFLLKREQGLHPSEDGIGIWSRRPSESGSVFVNILTNQTQRTPEPIWRGGLLADEMGLGKTLSMIALIASDQDRNNDNHFPGTNGAPGAELRSTLLIVPLSVLAVWETQLNSHVHRGRIRWFTHHGKSRLQLSNVAKPPDIVFTTYQTIEREKRSNKLDSSSIFTHHWKRIVLDEAHIIRNHNTSTARAIAALRATSRWAMSGTPIQNNLTDFLGLFKFLHFSPYDDPRVFDDDISNLWRTKPIDEAIEAFKKLLSCVMIRRPKSILQLPRRDDKIIRLLFDREEEEYYCRIEKPVVDMLDHATGVSSDSSMSWTNAIQQINKLRLVCNLGTFASSRHSSLNQSGGADRMIGTLAARVSLGEFCEQCLQPVDSSLAGNGLEDAESSNVYYSACNRLFCAACSALLRYQAPQPCACAVAQSSCPLRPLLSFVPTPRLTPSGDFSPLPMEMDNICQISSKIRALVSQIQANPTEKNVVFSAWTSSLDMVESGLTRENICFVRIDGKVATKKRSHAIQQFHHDPNVRVILITISCGACGLDLTAASQIHLLEPQWNPSIEDQALARAHRLGQTRAVTTFRYIMRNSFEEHILKVQDRKKLLATTLLSNNSSLQTLRQLVHGD